MCQRKLICVSFDAAMFNQKQTIYSNYIILLQIRRSNQEWIINKDINMISKLHQSFSQIYLRIQVSNKVFQFCWLLLVSNLKYYLIITLC